MDLAEKNDLRGWPEFQQVEIVEISHKIESTKIYSVKIHSEIYRGIGLILDAGMEEWWECELAPDWKGAYE